MKRAAASLFNRLLLALVVLPGWAAATDAAFVVTLPRAGLLLAGGDTPPPDDAAWQAQLLPDDWSRNRPGVTGDAWYRLEFRLQPGQVQLLALYVPRLSMAGIPYVNGAAIGAGMGLSDPVTRLFYRPQFYWIPAALLKPGVNVVHFRLRTSSSVPGGLSLVYVGDPDRLRAEWDWRVFQQVTLLQATTGITAALLVSVAVALLLLRWDRGFVYYALAAAAWLLHTALFLTTESWLTDSALSILMISALNWMAVAFLKLAHRYAELSRPWLERGAVAYAVSAPLVLWAAGPTYALPAVAFCYIISLGLAVYQWKVLFHMTRRQPSTPNRLLLTSAGIALALGVFDGLTRVDPSAFDRPAYGHYGVTLVFIAVLWALLAHMTESRREALQTADATRALAAERERIMRDMHDGIGSQLLAAKQLAQHRSLGADEFVTVLEECMDDLRLMIDAMELADGDLQAVLGNFRYRLSARLAHQSIALSWEIQDLPPMNRLSSSDILNILRILQEAFANALRHSLATRITFSALIAANGSLRLEVRDNGTGSAAARPPGPGRGLRNMQRRAEALGGTVRVTADGGYLVVLELPSARIAALA
ncbi:MAG: hypothetical protein IT162_17995 [Bryobacterales bacterium]|nr:hypothetical protein [Bryobacterales bacterium]